MSDLDTFIAFDLETTGLDPNSSEIIELGAVKVEGGQTTAEFGRLVRPQRPIPAGITRLTGITDDDVRDSPKISQALHAFRDFIGDLPLVAHNAPFDLGFLKEHSKIHIAQTVYDSLELARCLLPRLVSHKLGTLLRFFQIDENPIHRALSDAAATALVFLRLIDILMGKDLATVQAMARLVAGTGSSLEELLQKAAQALSQRAMLTKIRSRGVDTNCLRELFNIGGKTVSREIPSEEKTLQKLDVDQICSIFVEGGILARQLEGYEQREQQLAMARAVSQAFNDSQFLVVEAGTGTGKSLAYLVPAIYWAVRNNSRVVVSTNTKNLQEQLFYKDLPELSEILDVPFRSALLKGRSNYICLNKWHTALSQIETAFTDQERQAALPLMTWLEETKTGDIAENNGFAGFRNFSLWSKVCAESNYCLGQKCKYHSRCFVTKIRKAALKSHIVVVNHSLLFSDLALENGILGDYRELIFDEAHNIEKVATQYLGYQMDIWRIKTLTHRLYSKEFVEAGTLVSLRQRLTRARPNDPMIEAFSSQIRLLIGLSQSIWQQGRNLFEHLTREMKRHFKSDNTRYSQKLRFKKEDKIFDPFSEELEDFLDLITELQSELSKLSQWLRDLPDGSFQIQDELTADIEGRQLDCQEICGELAFLTAAEDEDYVYWLELPVKEESFDIRLLAAPLNISELLASQLYSRLRTVVFTSATIAVPRSPSLSGESGDFGYFTKRLGIEPAARAKTLAVGSPFDYNSQALVCVPSFIPSPKSLSFQKGVEEIIEALSAKIRRGTLVLFTSYGMLNRAYSNLSHLADIEGIPLLGQGLDGSRSNILAQFMEYSGSLLFGTESFWEGVDLPGQSLEVLVIVKLPFAVPSEPIVAAQMERLEKRGINSFFNYSLPEAVIKFRQGFGRLIRSKTDKGVIVILDTRVITKDYGKVFLDSLPTGHLALRSKEEMVRQIQKWFASRPD